MKLHVQGNEISLNGHRVAVLLAGCPRTIRDLFVEVIQSIQDLDELSTELVLLQSQVAETREEARPA